MPQEKPTPSLECYADQFILDLKSLSEGKIVSLAKGLPEEDKLSPIDCITNYIKQNPNRISNLLALVIEDMPYYAVVRHFRWIDKSLIYQKYFKEIIESIGEVRLTLALSSIEILLVGESFSKFKLKKLQINNPVVNEIPSVEKITELDAKISNDYVSLNDVDRNLAKLTKEAQQRAVKAENELRTEKIKWAEDQKRRNHEIQRGKQNSVEQAVIDISKELKLNIRTLEEKLEVELQAKKEVVADLKKAEKRLQEIEDFGGATPERVAEIRAEIQKDADKRLADELSDKTRPWITKIKNVTESYEDLDEATKLSRDALELAKKEAIEKDPILKWKTHSPQAIAALEAQLGQIGDLIRATVEPSPALVSMHSKLLELLTKCRERTNPSEPAGEVMKALHEGIKKVSADSIDEVIQALLLLSTFDVLAHEEGQNLKRALESRKRLLIESGKIKSTTKTKLKAAIHKKEKVVILVDVLNFIRRNDNEFIKFKKGKDSRGAVLYKLEAFDHLVKIVAPLRHANPKVDIHLFMDGNIIKNTLPRDGITFHNPIIQTTGEGQADAEIINFLAHSCPKDALVVTVTSDKVIQQTSDKHLDVGSFYTLLEDFKE
jgi:hypothetical protein